MKSKIFTSNQIKISLIKKESIEHKIDACKIFIVLVELIKTFSKRMWKFKKIEKPPTIERNLM